jgi:hypothetical protein
MAKKTEDKAKVIMEAVEDQVIKSGDDAKIQLGSKPTPKPKKDPRDEEIKQLKAEIARLTAKQVPKYETEESVEYHLWRSLRDHDDSGKKTCRHCGHRKPEADYDPKSEYCKDCS